MHFLMGRISLLSPKQIDAFERRSTDGAALSREEWLRVIFNKDFVFHHRRQPLHYVTLSGGSIEQPIMIGKIGKRGVVSENAPPEGRFEEIIHERWRAAYFFLDPRKHDDGQKVAIQTHRIGRPSAILSSMADEINSRSEQEPYIMETGIISRSDSFWSYVAENKGRITSASFEFIAPNMFPEDGDLDKEMADMRDKERVRRAKLEIENADGLQLNTPRIENAVDYTTRVGGTLRARAPGAAPYNSKDNSQIETVEDISGETEDELIEIAKKLFKT